MKSLNEKSKKILEKILGNITSINSLNSRVIKVKYSANYIRIEKRHLNNHGHIITLSTIVPNEKGRYYEIPRIRLLKLFKDSNYYPTECTNTKTNRSVIAAEVSRNGKGEYECTDLLIQKIITDFTDLHLVIINNSKILD